ncbi:MAG TPA: MFS transporter [Pirellulales bacterium]|jgi:MFS family permease|nr:MFS transporter [Pirellulales bacterium]
MTAISPEANHSPQPHANERSRWFIVALLLAINLLNYVDRYVLAAVEPHIRQDLFPDGAPNINALMGFLPTAFLLSYMIAAPIFGWLSDRVNRWWIIGGGVVVWSLASGGSGLASTYAMLLVTRLFIGVGEAAYGPAAPTVLADLFPVERRGRILSLLYVAIPVGSALGFLLGGFMGERFGWRMAFYVSLPPGILLGIICLLLRDPRYHARAAGEPARPVVNHSFADYVSLACIPSYVINTLGMAAMVFALGAVAFWMPNYIYRFRREDLPSGIEPSLERVNMIFGAITVTAGITATLFGGWLGDKLRPRWSGSYFLVSGFGMLIGTPIFLLVLVTPFPTAWGLIFLTEFCLLLNTGPANAVLANVTRPAIRASAFAINIFLIHLLGDAISPSLVGWITDLADGNMNVGFTAVTVAIALSGVLWIAGARFLAADTAAVVEAGESD